MDGDEVASLHHLDPCPPARKHHLLSASLGDVGVITNQGCTKPANASNQGSNPQAHNANGLFMSSDAGVLGFASCVPAFNDACASGM